MKNSHLSRRVERVKGDTESVIDELIAEIEEKESEIDTLTNKIAELEEKIENLQNN